VQVRQWAASPGRAFCLPPPLPASSNQIPVSYFLSETSSLFSHSSSSPLPTNIEHRENPLHWLVTNLLTITKTFGTLLHIKTSKVVSVTGLRGLQGCEILRIPRCLDNRLTDAGKVDSPTHRPRSTPQKYYFSALGNNFC
jgi:hypothetical protein